LTQQSYLLAFLKELFAILFLQDTQEHNWWDSCYEHHDAVSDGYDESVDLPDITHSVADTKSNQVDGSNQCYKDVSCIFNALALDFVFEIRSLFAEVISEEKAFW